MTASGNQHMKSSSGSRPESSPESSTAAPPLASDALLNALPHPIIVLGADEQLNFANAAAESFFQTSLAILLKQRLIDIVAFGSPLLALVEQVRRSGVTVNEYAISLGTPKFASNKLVDVFAGPLPQNPDQVLVILQQRSMAQMIERQFTHRAAARTVSGMAAVLAHEIKNPLSGIKGAAQLLQTSVGDDDRSLTQLICSETDRICNLVDHMEVFGDERPIKKAPTNIHDVLNHVKQLAEHGVARGITIVENYDPSLPSVPGNRDSLVQALLNLVKNAAEAIAENGEQGRIALTTAFRPGVRLSVQATGERISLPLMIEVEDNGGGIPEGMKPHLFDPFVTSKRQSKGLGLALVAKIIGDHGGIIECDSRPKRTIFRILLPMHTSTSPTAADGDEGSQQINAGETSAANKD